jgi:hypothetical protein
MVCLRPICSRANGSCRPMRPMWTNAHMGA